MWPARYISADHSMILAIRSSRAPTGLFRCRHLLRSTVCSWYLRTWTSGLNIRQSHTKPFEFRHFFSMSQSCCGPKRHNQGRPRPGPRPTTSASSAAASLTFLYSSGCHFDFRGQTLSMMSVVRTFWPSRATKAFQTRSRTRPRHTRFVIRPSPAALFLRWPAGSLWPQEPCY
jgi:hypothetical protein